MENRQVLNDIFYRGVSQEVTPTVLDAKALAKQLSSMAPGGGPAPLPGVRLSRILTHEKQLENSDPSQSILNGCVCVCVCVCGQMPATKKEESTGGSKQAAKDPQISGMNWNDETIKITWFTVLRTLSLSHTRLSSIPFAYAEEEEERRDSVGFLEVVE
jgi:hypothetical protein